MQHYDPNPTHIGKKAGVDAFTTSRVLEAFGQYLVGMGLTEEDYTEARSKAPDLFPNQNVLRRIVDGELELEYAHRLTGVPKDTVRALSAAYEEDMARLGISGDEIPEEFLKSLPSNPLWGSGLLSEE